jgi:hypothetical protein
MVSQTNEAVPAQATGTRVRPHGPLIALTGALVFLCLLTVIGLLVDDRQLDGAPIWLKPFKFTVSFAIYSGTLALLLPRLTRWPRLVWWTGTVVALALAAEMTAIAGQAMRGTYSHFNTMTPFDAFVIKVMTVGVFLLFATNLVAIVALLRNRSFGPEFRWAFRLGLIVMLIGMGIGFLMNTPTPTQREAIKEGVPTLIGGHSVGVPDGGPGMPMTYWSTTGGDLRIPHFVAIHALQLIPLAALVIHLLSQRVSSLREPGTRVALVVVAAVGYAGLVALLTWQALRGQPLLSPDGRTLSALGLLAAVIAGAAATVVLTGRSARQSV